MAGEASTARMSTAGTAPTSHRRQNHVRYSAAAVVANQIPRVNPSRSATPMNAAHVVQSHARFRDPQPKNMNAVIMSSANISWPEKVIQWLINPVIRSGT